MSSKYNQIASLEKVQKTTHSVQRRIARKGCKKAMKKIRNTAANGGWKTTFLVSEIYLDPLLIPAGLDHVWVLGFISKYLSMKGFVVTPRTKMISDNCNILYISWGISECKVKG